MLKPSTRSTIAGRMVMVVLGCEDVGRPKDDKVFSSSVETKSSN